MNDSSTMGGPGPQGSLELAILAALWKGRCTAWRFCGCWRRLEPHRRRGHGLPVAQSSESGGLIDSDGWNPKGHPRKYYWLTKAGRQRARRWRRLAEFAASLAALIQPLLSESTEGTMTGNNESTQLMEYYLGRLGRAAAKFPPAEREEIVAEIRSHIWSGRRPTAWWRQAGPGDPGSAGTPERSHPIRHQRAARARAGSRSPWCSFAHLHWRRWGQGFGSS